MTALQARFKSVVWKSVPGSRRTDLFLRIIRVVILTVRGFNNDLCVVRASTLTFYTLLSIVPLFATVFGIAKGFGLHQLLERQLSSRIDWLRELIAVLLKFSSAAIENARGGIIAGIGVLVFFVTVVGLLGAVEEAFNTIWEVRKPRSLGRKFADYLSVVLIGTVLLSVSGGINVFIAAQVRLVADRVAFLAPAGQAMLLLLGLVPYVANWLLFAFLFLFIPNTPVPLYAGIVAGAFTAGIFLLVQWIYITFQVGVSNYNAIYGSFAALPLFLVWMQLSWTITLLGGELSWAVVNSRTYGFFPDFPSISPYLRKVIASAIVMEIKQAFVAGKQPLTQGRFARRYGFHGNFSIRWPAS